MGCCGKQSGSVRTVKQIVSGHTHRLFDHIFMVRGQRYQRAHKREAVCRRCDQATWLRKRDYLKWLAANGIDIANHLDDLTSLPPLDKHDYEPGRSLFCRICKCWIPAKCYSPDAVCPLGRWPAAVSAQDVH